MQHVNSIKKVFSGTVLALMCLSFSGCALMQTKEPPPAPQVIKQVLPVFPPQSVMQSGDYAAFIAENEKALQSNPEPENYSIALFNLGFAYSYSKSPKYDPHKGIRYFDDLIKSGPETPWAYQARAWLDLLKKSVTSESKRRQMREEVKSMQTIIGDLSKPAESPTDSGAPTPEAVAAEAMLDRQNLEDQIRARDETIKRLHRQLERYRQIDREIEKKERELLN